MNTFFVILICILLYILLLKTEGFEDVESTFLTKYNKFMKFYNTLYVVRAVPMPNLCDEIPLQTTPILTPRKEVHN